MNAPAAPAPVRLLPPGGGYAVAVLTVMNLLNYVDRYVPSAVKDLFKADLGLTDAETSLPLTAFVLVYMVASPLFGSVADRVKRTWVIAGGVALWSVATAAASLATGFWTFLLARALVGVGEAAYATLAPALISDFYPPDRRNRILTLFYVAIPVGAALGFVMGGVLGAHGGWRLAFVACGLPGLLAALAALGIKDPGRGTFDDDKGAAPPSWPDAFRALAKNHTYLFAVAGYTLVTFASGALADWFPTVLVRLRGIPMDEAASITGVASALGGLGGTVAGGLLADRLKDRTRQPYFAVSAVSMALTTLLAVAGLFVHHKVAIFVFILAAQFFMFFYNGPINSILVNCVPSALRARAFSLSILSIHLLGDAVSPFLVGVLSDVTGNLMGAISVVPLALAGGAAIWWVAWRRLPPPSAAQSAHSPAHG